MSTTSPSAGFHAMTEGTQEDWDRIVAAQLEFYPGLADRVMTHLGLLAGDYDGFVVDRLVHSTQTATRAMRANRSDDYIACALLHDIGDTLGSFNHPDIGAAIVWPFVDDDLHWMVQQHGIFQGYYFFDYLGLDPNLRDRFEGPSPLRPVRRVLRRLRPGRLRSRLPDDGARGVPAAARGVLRPPEALDLHAR
jgi:hypothetical protein